MVRTISIGAPARVPREAIDQEAEQVMSRRIGGSTHQDAPLMHESRGPSACDGAGPEPGPEAVVAEYCPHG